MRLSSGREVDGNRDLFSPGDDGALYEGYDGVVDASMEYERDWPGAKQPLTDEERREVAEQMIARWRAWAALGNAEGG